MINHNNSLYVSLSDSTSDLIERYADLDAEGYICNFHIINKEIIEALHSAKEWLQGLLQLRNRSGPSSPGCCR